MLAGYGPPAAHLVPRSFEGFGGNTVTRRYERTGASGRLSGFHRRLIVALIVLLTVGGLPLAPASPIAAQSGQMPATSMTGPGTYKLTATREGLVGGMTSSGHTILPNDHFVSLPACTTTSCPWLDPGELPERWGNRTECGDRCYVKVINEDTGSCEVAPVLDTGPWFTVDDWWRPTNERYLNSLATNPNTLPQGVTGASAARNGLDVGYGVGPSGYGSSNRYATVGNASAIDLADGTWMALGLDFNKGIDVIDVELLWQTGASPAAEAAACGHSLDQTGTTGTLSISPTSGTVGSTITVTGDGFTGGESVTLHAGSPSTAAFTTVTANGSGAISATVTVPDAPYGTNAIIAIGRASGVDKRANFRITPSIQRSPTEGQVGSPVQFTVHGFGANEDVRITWDNASGGLITTIRTNARGTGSATIAVPNRPAGWNTYYARGVTSQAGAYGAFNVLASEVTNPAGTSNPTFSGAKLTPVSSSGTSNATSSTVVWDGNASTSWYTTSPNPTSGGFTIDYGDVHQLTGVRWRLQTTGEADSFLVETSIDGTRWETVGTFGNAPVNSWRGIDLDRQGRYLRVTFGNPNGDARLGGISEIEFWGTDASNSPGSAPAGSNPQFSGSKLQIVGSSSTRSGIPSARAHDGNLSTSWYTDGANPSEASLTFDLGSPRQVSGVKWTFSQEGGADSLTVTVSRDGQLWTTVGTSSNRQPGTWEGMHLDQSIRYVRLIFTNPYGAPSLGHVAEVEIWGSGGTGSTPPPTTPTPYPGSNPSFSGSPLAIASASSTALPAGQQTTSAARAVDGNLGTTWATTGGNPERATLTLDLGTARSVSGVKWIYSQSDGVDQQILQVSADGTNWTQKVITSWRQPMQWEGFAVNENVRYVRLILTNSKGLPVLGHIAEVQVWGTNTSNSTPTATPTATQTPTATPTQTPTATATSTAVPTDPVVDAIVRSLIGILQQIISESAAPQSMARMQIEASEEESADATTADIVATPVGATPAMDKGSETPAATPTDQEVADADDIDAVDATPASPPPTAAEEATATVTPTDRVEAIATPDVVETSDDTKTATASETTEMTQTPASTTPDETPTTATARETVEVDATPTATEPLEESSPVETETPQTEWTYVPVEPWIGYVWGTNGEALNCRAEPTTSGEIVTKLWPDAPVTVLGEPVEGWLPVRCTEMEGWVASEFISASQPTVEATPEDDLAEASTTETEDGLGDQPEETEDAAPVPRVLTVPVSSDFSLSGTDGVNEGTPGTLLVGGDDQDVAVMTFDVSGVGDGKVVSARLLVSGTQEGAGGSVIVLPGFWADPWSASWSDLVNSGGGAGWLDWIGAGSTSGVDLSGWINGDGPVTIIVIGTSDQQAGIASQESGSPPTLVLEIED